MGIEITDPDQYRSSLIGLLDGQDPLQVLQNTPSVIREIIQPYTNEQLRSHPYENKWSPLEIVGHLSDVEWNFGIRLRFILCEDKPTIIGYDQDLWVPRLQHNKQEPQTLIDMFSSLRSFNIALYKDIPNDQMKRYGLHNERGEESLETMLPLEAGHDLYHLRQLKEYLSAIQK